MITLTLLHCDTHAVGIYNGCPLRNRLLYPLFHANIIHATLNTWCLLTLVFYYQTPLHRILFAYIIAVSAPVHTTLPTVGCSGILFTLFGRQSFEVQRKTYYQAWMTLYLIAGLLFPHTNGIVHLYCYTIGLLVALLCKPIKIKRP